MIEQRHTSVKRILESIQAADVVIPCPPPFHIVSLGHDELFDLSIGDRALSSQSTGEGIPIYSASVQEIFGFTSLPNLTDFEQDSLMGYCLGFRLEFYSRQVKNVPQQITAV